VGVTGEAARRSFGGTGRGGGVVPRTWAAATWPWLAAQCKGAARWKRLLVVADALKEDVRGAGKRLVSIQRARVWCVSHAYRTWLPRPPSKTSARGWRSGCGSRGVVRGDIKGGEARRCQLPCGRRGGWRRRPTAGRARRPHTAGFVGGNTRCRTGPNARRGSTACNPPAARTRWKNATRGRPVAATWGSLAATPATPRGPRSLRKSCGACPPATARSARMRASQTTLAPRAARSPPRKSSPASPSRSRPSSKHAR